MAVEPRRGCGFRKVGGLYLIGSGFAWPCDRLPFNLEICPVCGAGIKFSRGWQTIDWRTFAGEHKSCNCISQCQVCHPKYERYGLMWVGKRYYTPETFTHEAITRGVCKRVPFIPRDLTEWVLLAHPEAGIKTQENGEDILITREKDKCPAIFYAFKVTGIEMLVDEGTSKEELERLEKRGITPVLIPDNDPDHYDDYDNNNHRTTSLGI